MQIRTHFVALVVLVTAVGLAGARISQGDPADKTASGQMATTASCTAAVAAPTANLGLPAMLSRSASERSSSSANVFPPPCSVCSDSVCQTHSVGVPCGGTKTCQQLSDQLCSTDGQITCRCVTGIP